MLERFFPVQSSEVIAAYEETGFEPRRATWVGRREACALGVLWLVRERANIPEYMLRLAAIPEDSHVKVTDTVIEEISAKAMYWALENFDQTFKYGFTSGFDGSPAYGTYNPILHPRSYWMYNWGRLNGEQVRKDVARWLEEKAQGEPEGEPPTPHVLPVPDTFPRSWEKEIEEKEVNAL